MAFQVRHGSAIDLSSADDLFAAWRQHSGELYAVARRSLGNEADADEALQETFVRAWAAAPGYDSERPLRPWLFTILRHLIIDE